MTRNEAVARMAELLQEAIADADKIHAWASHAGAVAAQHHAAQCRHHIAEALTMVQLGDLWEANGDE